MTERRVLQGAKTGLAHDTLEHHASGHTGVCVLSDQGFSGFLAVQGEKFGSVVQRLEVVRKSDAVAVFLLLADQFEFFAALVDELVFVRCRSGFGGGGGSGVRHALILSGRSSGVSPASL